MTPHEQIRELTNRALNDPGCALADRWLRAHPPEVALDIGANEGGWTGYLLDRGAEQVHCFEPVPLVFEKLAASYGTNARVVLNRKAVADTPGRKTGVRVLNAHTLADPAEVALDVAREDAGAFEMELITVDDYVKERGLRVDFIKLDTDGYEPMALRGMAETLRQFKPVLHLELSYLPRKLGENCEAMIDWLYTRGYKICTMGGKVCDDPILVLEGFPWRTSIDVMAIPASRITAHWTRLS